MTHASSNDLTGEVEIQDGAIVSKVIHRDDTLNITVFGIAAGQEMTEHRSPRHAIVEVLSGRLAFTVDGEELDAGAGFWLHMDPDTPHSLVAREPTVMLLTLV